MTDLAKKRIRDRDYMRRRRATRPDVVQKERDWMRDARNSDPLPFMIRAAKHRAKVQELAFDLDIAWAREWWTGRCELTALEFRPTIGGQSARSPSIDRRDPRAGYLKGNCRFVLSAINSFKGSGSDAEMIEIAEALLGARKWT